MREKWTLRREMGLKDAALLVMGSMIGSGIFMTTGFVVASVPNAGAVILIWAVGGLITVCGALSFGELGAMFPRAGGQFVYLKEAYGEWCGFLYGWGFFWIIECGGIAALAVGFAEYLGYFVPGLSNQSAFIRLSALGLPCSISWGQVVAVGAIGVLSGVNYFGLRSGVFVQNLFTFIRIACLAGLIILGWLVGKKTGVDIGRFFEHGGALDFKSIGLALFAVLWTYDGWYAVNCTAEEVRAPHKTIPLSLLIGTLGVAAIYLLMNVLYLVALPIEELSGVARVGELAATGMFGPKAASPVAAGIMVAVFGCLSATILYGPRVYYAMAEDGIFFRGMSRIHPRYRVPSRAIAGQAVWSSLLCLTGTYQTLYEYVVFALVFFFAATGAAVLVLRAKKPDANRPYRVWGFPFVPLVFILINTAIFLNSFFSQPRESLIGLGIILSGIPAFIFWKSKSRERD